jgi:hypothetical protein
MDIVYRINGIDIKEQCGVCVASSEGIVNLPKLKKPQSYSWADRHGEVVDLEHKYYEAREISLSCFLNAPTREEFIRRLIDFEELFTRTGTLQLMIEAVSGKPLVYQVYCPDGISVTKEWSDSLMVGTFKLKLIEPEPLKRVLRFTGGGTGAAACSIRVTTVKPINIFWGDEKSDNFITGTNLETRHTYSRQGVYYIVVAGCVEEISVFTTNAETIWNRL